MFSWLGHMKTNTEKGGFILLQNIYTHLPDDNNTS